MARKKWRRVKLLRRILRTTQHTRSANKTFLAPNSRTVRNPPLLKWRLGMYRILGVVYPRGGSPLVARLVWFQFYDQYRSWKKKPYFINSLWNWSQAEREKKKKEKSEKNIHIAGSPVRSSEYLIEYGPLKAYYFLNTISSCESEWFGFRQEMRQKQL